MFGRSLVWFGLVLLSLGAGGIGAVWTTAAIPTWYASLARPSWSPPNAAFAPVWTTLYVLMGTAAFLVWLRAGLGWALGLFFIQLVLNAAWSWVFFGLKSPGWAFAEIVVLWVAIVATMTAFRRHSVPATFLMSPYLAWVTFASALNFAIWRMNPRPRP